MEKEKKGEDKGIKGRRWRREKQRKTGGKEEGEEGE